MKEDNHESSSSGGCDNQIEFLVSEAERRRRVNQLDTEVHELGYDPFSYCGRRVHVLLLTKLISVLTIPFYIAIVIFISFFGNATSVMFSIIILGSVVISTCYGAFRGAKMCLIPFVILQLVFLIYDLILIAILLLAVVFPKMFLSALLRLPLEDIPIGTDQVLLGCSLLLALLLAPLVWTTHVVYIDFLFISQVDETLHMLKEANQKVSQDDVSPNRMMF
uniref:Transmembrane protein 159 n=1 Tax=Caenorhabditis tropicalis TaxID=1561998 RepID=A0A1I7TZR1_9PELO